jgi:hypothetical protein
MDVVNYLQVLDAYRRAENARMKEKIENDTATHDEVAAYGWWALKFYWDIETVLDGLAYDTPKPIRDCCHVLQRAANLIVDDCEKFLTPAKK